MKSLDARDDFQTPPTRPPTARPRKPRRRCTRKRCFWNVCCPAAVGAVFAVALLAAAIVFVPWFLVDIWPDMVLEESMETTTCLVTNHTVIDTKWIDANTRLLYMPGLAVVVSAGPRTAVATARVERADSWMSAEVMADYFARYPINATSPCYANDERVAMQPGVDSIGTRLGGCIAITVTTFVSALLLTPFVVVPLLCCIRIVMY
nr:hypothetical protein [Pandoravirus belohorizontensis]